MNSRTRTSIILIRVISFLQMPTTKEKRKKGTISTASGLRIPAARQRHDVYPAAVLRRHACQQAPVKTWCRRPYADSYLHATVARGQWQWRQCPDNFLNVAVPSGDNTHCICIARTVCSNGGLRRRPGDMAWHDPACMLTADEWSTEV